MKTSFITSAVILALLALAPAGRAGLTTDPLGNAPVKPGTSTLPKNQGITSDPLGLVSDPLGVKAKTLPKSPATSDLWTDMTTTVLWEKPSLWTSMGTTSTLTEKPANGYTTVDVPAEIAPKAANGRADILVCTDELDAEGNILSSHGEVITLGVAVKNGRLTGNFALPALGATPAERVKRIVTVGYRTGMEVDFRLLIQVRESELNTAAVFGAKLRGSGHTLDVQVTRNAPKALTVIANPNTKVKVEIRDLSKASGWSVVSETPALGRIAMAELPGLQGDALTGDAGDDGRSRQARQNVAGGNNGTKLCGGADDDQLCGGADDDQIADILVDTAMGATRTLRVTVR